MPPKMQAKKRYSKMKHVDFVLKRPDTYAGSTRLRKLNEYIAEPFEGSFRLYQDEITSCPAILRIFVEPLSNAIDNVERSRKAKTPCTKIVVKINQETGETSIWNDGDVVPVEIDEEENCYNHSMIFGQLLTGSNYDDEEERIISGRNGLGVKLCLKRGTLVPKFDGTISKVEDVLIGDQLIGDDGFPRNVTNKCEGNGRLYEVSQARGNSYIVNENHILTVRMPDHKVIFWNQAKNGWIMLWLDKEEKKVHMKSISADKPEIKCPECEQTLAGNLNRHYKRQHTNVPIPKLPRLSPTMEAPDTEEVRKAYAEIEEFASSIQDDNTLEISIKEYMKMTPTMKGRLTGFMGECVQWEEKKVELDPYVLGLWLGDGFQRGDRFAINSVDDPEILDYLTYWGSNNDATFKQCITQPVSFSISSTSKSGVAPLKKLLSRYDLVNNKHIPQDYLVNSREVRLSVLAGLIDSDGTVQADGRRITIAQGMDHSGLAGDIIFLVKSLGFVCSSHIKKTQWQYQGELQRGNAININISGNGVEDIPTRVPRKKCAAPLRREVTNTGKLSVKEVDAGEYVGLEVDHNHRFVLEDFTVTHNCNVFSTSFKVRGFDPKTKKLLTQEWHNNMKDTDGPVVKASKMSKGFTEVTWTPDFKQFKMEGYTDDIVNLYTRYVVDAAMLCKVPVYINDTLVPVTGLLPYSRLYHTPTNESLAIKTRTCEVVVTPASEFQAVSFVNGVHTKLGGRHVDAWAEAIFRPLVNKFNKKGKPQINIGDVKRFFRLFVVSTLVNPEFDHQEKHKLESPGVTVSVQAKHINAIAKWTVCDQIEDIIRGKEMVVLKKASQRKKGYTKVEGLDPANNAGSKFSPDCTLIICEGLSAKTYAVAGIEKGVYGKAGRDWFGIYPIRGKLQNVRNATPAAIAKNREITDLIQAIGVRHGVDYTDDKNYRTLRYGRVMIMTDADVDGIHIEGLVMNFFHTLFPTLFERDESFLVSMKTPIVRVFRPRGQDLLFYDERRFREYQAKQKRKFESKYYKGLGSSKSEDVPDTFGTKMIEFVNDEDAAVNMNKVFHKKHSDARKDWLGRYDPSNELSLDDVDEVYQMGMTDFVDGELIKFSLNDCKRSIPSGVDGLKESQRKILYAVKKRKLKYGGKSLKVAQLGGYVAEHTNYHHGEQNLYDTITKMANEFPGSNNIPLLYRDGQFGSRLEGGKDAASARYIFTKMDMLTHLIFREEDDVLLERVVDDGDIVEPRFYVPILPMILVNGCFAPDTPVPLWNGTIKLAKDIAVGDDLIGDDGSPRTVLSLCSGADRMYRISQKKAEDYVVNSQHTLTLKMSGDRTIYWSESRRAWKMEWFQNGRVKSKFVSGLIVGRNKAYEEISTFASTLPDTHGLVEMTVEEYLRLPKSVQARMKGYRSAAVTQWKHQDVCLDPYILGAWLGDGDSHGRGFSNIDKEVISAFEHWCEDNDAELAQTDDYHYYIRRKTRTPGMRHSNPLKEQLELYNLIENKHIPNEYIINSENVRLQVLAGLIDTDGHVYHDGEQIVITQAEDRKVIIDGIVRLARSLGLCCHTGATMNSIVRDGQRHYYPEIRLNISGEGIEKIPTKIERKRCSSRREEQRDCMLSQICVSPVGSGEYYGWEVDGNKRFILEDHTVTHNCTAGIGTGWSCNVPCYDPLDLIASIKVWLDNDGEAIIQDEDGTMVSMLPDLTPWYRGFDGAIEPGATGKFITRGICEDGPRNTVVVTELPIGMWTKKFKEDMEDYLEAKHIKAMRNYSSPKKVKFVLTEAPNGIDLDAESLKLHSYLYTTNMVLFNEKDQLRKHTTVDEIIDEFCKLRYEYYVRRKKHQLNELEQEARFLGNKERFIREVMDKTIKIMKVKEEVVVKVLEERGYDKQVKKVTEDGEEVGGYDYLLRMQIRTFTVEKVQKMKDDIASKFRELDALKAKSEKDLWLTDLKEFEGAYRQFLKAMEAEKPKVRKAK